MNFGLDDKIKEILVDIKFRERYAELSEKYRQVKFEKSMKTYDKDLVISMFKEIGYKANFFKSEKFFQIKEKEKNIEFIFNVSIERGLCELIWSMRKDGEIVNLSTWGGISRQLHIENEVIKDPIFTNYEELKEILEIAFNIYVDFKNEAIKNIDEIKSRGF